MVVSQPSMGSSSKGSGGGALGHATALLRVATAQTAVDLGFRAATAPALDMLTHLLRERLRDTAQRVKAMADLAGRNEAVLEDVGLALESQGERVSELADFARQAKLRPFPFPVPHLPAPKPHKPLYAPPPSDAELASRSEAIPSYFPSIYPPTKAGKLAALRDCAAEPAGRLRQRRTTSTVDRRFSRSLSHSKAGLPDFAAVTAESLGLVRWVDPPPPKVTIKPLAAPPTVPPPPPELPSRPPLPPPLALAPELHRPAPASPLKLKITGLQAEPAQMPATSVEPGEIPPSPAKPKAKVGRPPGPKNRPPNYLKKKQPTVTKEKADRMMYQVPSAAGSLKFLFPRPGGLGSMAASSASPLGPLPRPPSAQGPSSLEKPLQPPTPPPVTKPTVPTLKVRLSPSKSPTAKPASPKKEEPILASQYQRAHAIATDIRSSSGAKKATPTSQTKSAASSLPGIFGRPKATPAMAAAEAKKKSALKIKLKVPGKSASQTSLPQASASREKAAKKEKKKAKKEKRKEKEEAKEKEDGELTTSTATSHDTSQESPSKGAELPKLKLKIRTPIASPDKEAEKEPEVVKPLKISIGGLMRSKGVESAVASPRSVASSPPPPPTPGGDDSPIPKTPSPHRDSTPVAESGPSAVIGKLVSGPLAKVVKQKAKGKADKKAKESTSKAKQSPKASVTPVVAAAEPAAEDEGVWICPVCNVAWSQDADMIGCDGCTELGLDRWFHWGCVGLIAEPPEDIPWHCPDCSKAPKSGRGTPKGGGKGQGAKRKAASPAASSAKKRKKKL